MKDLDTVIRCNKYINAAVKDRRVEDAAKWLRRLHKVEIKNRVPIGSYRLRNIEV